MPAAYPTSGYPEPGSTAPPGEAALCAKKTGRTEDLAVGGIDIGKDTFHLLGLDRAGQLVVRKKIKRFALTATFEQLLRCPASAPILSAGYATRLNTLQTSASRKRMWRWYGPRQGAERKCHRRQR